MTAKTFRIQYKYWLRIWGTHGLWKCRSQRTYMAATAEAAISHFKRDRRNGIVNDSAEIMKVWELVG